MENANKHHLTSIYTAQLIRQDELCFSQLMKKRAISFILLEL